MATFDDLSNKFNAAINEFGTNSQDDRSWSLLDARQYEIMDSVIDNSKTAVRICREELNDTDTAEFYLAKSRDYDRRAANAKRKWAQRRGLWTNAQENAFLQKYRSDGGR